MARIEPILNLLVPIFQFLFKFWAAERSEGGAWKAVCMQMCIQRISDEMSNGQRSDSARNGRDKRRARSAIRMNIAHKSHFANSAARDLSREADVDQDRSIFDHLWTDESGNTSGRDDDVRIRSNVDKI